MQVPVQTQQTDFTQPVEARYDVRPMEGAALEGVGKALEQAANVPYEHGMQLAKINNESTATDAFTQTYTSKTQPVIDQFHSLSGKAKADALPATLAKLDETRQEIRASLTNPMQQEMFDAMSRGQIVRTGNALSAEAGDALRQWHSQSSASMIDHLTTTAANNANNPTMVDQQAQGIRAQVRGYYQGIGQSPTDPLTVAAEQKAVSRMYAMTAKTLSLHDPNAAIDMFDRHVNDFTPEDRLTLEPELNARATARNAVGIATAFSTGTGTYAPDAWLAAISKVESNDNPGAVSPKGAISQYQMKPDTAQETARKLGIPYDPQAMQDNPVYAKNLAQSHLKSLIFKYGADPVLVNAAYNAGGATVDGWLKTIGDPRTGAISDAAFAAAIPYPETKAYVARVGAVLGAPTVAANGPLTPTNAPNRVKELDEYMKMVAPNDETPARLATGALAAQVGHYQHAQGVNSLRAINALYPAM